MPDSLGPASEFGGKVQTNGVQPLPHTPDPKERMMLMYRTGDESGLTEPDNGESFSGLRPADVQLAKREAEGVMDKGQVWNAMQQAGEIAQQEIKNAQAQDE